MCFPAGYKAGYRLQLQLRFPGGCLEWGEAESGDQPGPRALGKGGGTAQGGSAGSGGGSLRTLNTPYPGPLVKVPEQTTTHCPMSPSNSVFHTT